MKTFILLSSISYVALGQTCYDMGGYSCDQYKDYYDCATLESYGWTCTGCDCGTATEAPQVGCKDLGGYNCDQYVDYYSCSDLESQYSWDCSGCGCGNAKLGDPQEPSDEDYKVWEEAVDAQDTLQTRDSSCAYPDNFRGLDALGRPSYVQTSNSGDYKFIFQNGATVALTRNSRQDSIKITCYVAGDDSYTTPATFPWDVTLTEEQYDQASQAFEEHDTNGDGSLTQGGAYTALHSLTPDVPEDILEALASWDNNGDGTVDFDEFLHMYDYVLFVQQAYESFIKFDTNGDGSISTDEIKPALQNLGLPGYLADELISYEDQDQDGTISFEEYMQMLQDEQQFLGESSTSTAPHADEGAALSETQRQTLGQAFDHFDTNEDTQLSQPEWREFLMLADAFASVDDQDFRDEHGYTCADWKNYDCDKAKNFGYSDDGLADLLANCPSSCPKCQVKNQPGAGTNQDGSLKPTDQRKNSRQLQRSTNTACLETTDGTTFQQDDDCCGLIGQTKCAKGYTYYQGQVCTPNNDGRGTRYTTVCVDSSVNSTSTGPEDLSCVFEELIHQADDNRDGHVDRAEFIDFFQEIKERVTENDFEILMNAVQNAVVPDCYTFTTCAECTKALNAGLCGWNQLNQNWRSGYYYQDRAAGRKLANYNSYYNYNYYYGSGGYGWCTSMDQDQYYLNYYDVSVATSEQQCESIATN